VEFFDTNGAAEAAGFRACKRCTPNGASLAEQHAAKIAQVCRLMETAEEPPQLQAMADLAGLSAFHFHRVFKSITGLTPKQYAGAHRAQRIQRELRGSETVTEAVYAAGYNSSSRFYAAADSLLGMTPSSYRGGGDGATIRFAVGECSLGPILVARSERGVCAILLGDDLEEDLRERFPKATLIADDGLTLAAAIALVDVPGTGFNLPLDIRGTVFQQRVWKALQAIPIGQTASYTEIAQQIGAPKSVRAVAGACATNALAVAIPCHRVVRNDGGLSGYRWGVERKRALLKREARE
jgi:AraC family transcriptional regulator of adaptative response/methylated-DNA-[protein]-cysteine methyltransferase